MPSVLFVCTGNLYRSPLAEAFFRKAVKKKTHGEEWIINSAGTWTETGAPIHDQTIEDALRYGLDVRNHQCLQVSGELLSKYDLILVMEAGHKEALQIEFPSQAGKIHLLSEVVDNLRYDIPDPFSIEGNHDREIVSELNKLIARGHERIMTLARKLNQKTIMGENDDR